MSIEQLTRDPKIWEVAHYFAIAMGEVPNSFSTTIRTLIGDHQKDPEHYSRGGGFLATRLLKSQSVAVPLFFATKTFYPDRISKSDTLTPGEILSIYRPLDLAALFATMYAFRKCRRRAAGEHWAPLSKVLMESADIGGLVGIAMPKIGFAYGLLAGAFTYISIAPFIMQNPKAYKELKRKVAAQGKRYDFEQELALLGCTHAHIGSFILPALGLGVEVSQAITESSMAEFGTPPAIDKISYRPYIANVWIETLLNTGAVPDITHKGGFYPLKADLDKLLTAVAGIKGSGSQHAWLDKSKTDEQSSPDNLTDETGLPAGELPESTPTDIEQ